MSLKPKWGTGPVITLVYGSAVVAYVPVEIGSMLVIPQESAAASVPFGAVLPGVTQVFDGAVAGGVAIALGDVVYHVNSGTHKGRFNKTSTNNVRAGFALSVAAASEDTFRLAATGAA